MIRGVVNVPMEAILTLRVRGPTGTELDFDGVKKVRGGGLTYLPPLDTPHQPDEAHGSIAQGASGL
jgi:hypothetical protein